MPAEIFPTRYRCTFHGFSAAWGKIGSVVVQAILAAVLKKSTNPKVFYSPDELGQQATNLSDVLIVFSFVMLAGFPVTWICIPEVQVRKGPDFKLCSRSLEELSRGITNGQDSQVIGMVKIRACLQKIWKREESTSGVMDTDTVQPEEPVNGAASSPRDRPISVHDHQPG